MGDVVKNFIKNVLSYKIPDIAQDVAIFQGWLLIKSTKDDVSATKTR